MIQQRGQWETEPWLPNSVSSRGEDEKPTEMFDNPLYGATGKSASRGKEQEPQRKDHLIPPDPIFAFPKPSDGDPDRPPVPTPRIRSFTCSETKPQASAPATLQPQSFKKPVVPSRSEGGVMQCNNRPPLPVKSRPGQPEPQPSKPRDYRDSSELPSKHRQPARPSQPHPKEGKTNFVSIMKMPFVCSYISNLGNKRTWRYLHTQLFLAGAGCKLRCKLLRPK